MSINIFLIDYYLVNNRIPSCFVKVIIFYKKNVGFQNKYVGAIYCTFHIW
jgi:hypothetical protein